MEILVSAMTNVMENDEIVRVCVTLLSNSLTEREIAVNLAIEDGSAIGKKYYDH